MDMVLVPAGKFDMGSNEIFNEKPIHTVYISKHSTLEGIL